MFSFDTLQLNLAYRPMVDSLFNLGKNLKYTLDSRMALLAADSLQVYYLAKGMGRDPDGADMLQFAEDLKRELARTNGKKAAKPLPSEAEPGGAATAATRRTKRLTAGEEVSAVTEE
jgi:hypothetical protein